MRRVRHWEHTATNITTAVCQSRDYESVAWARRCTSVLAWFQFLILVFLNTGFGRALLTTTKTRIRILTPCQLIQKTHPLSKLRQSTLQGMTCSCRGRGSG